MPYAPPPITATAAITAIDLASLGENIEGPPFMGATTLMVANDAWSKLRGDTPLRDKRGERASPVARAPRGGEDKLTRWRRRETEISAGLMLSADSRAMS